MELYILRHGETEENIQHILQGHTDGHLTELGRQQAHDAGKLLRNIHFDAFLCSDLKRCTDTAEIISSFLDMNIQTTPLLRERDWGSVTGEVVDATHRIVVPDDAETVPAMKARARVFLDYVADTYAGKRVLAVSHGLICRCLQAVHYGKELAEVDRMKNAEYRVLNL